MSASARRSDAAKKKNDAARKKSVAGVKKKNDVGAKKSVAGVKKKRASSRPIGRFRRRNVPRCNVASSRRP